MVYRRSARSYQGSRPGFNRKRRRTSALSKVYRQSASSRNQKFQIARVTKLALSNRRILSASRVYTDWVLQNTLALSGNGWSVLPLMDPPSWTSTMRQNLDVITQNQTFVRNLAFSWFCRTNGKSEAVTWNMFLVTIRPDTAWIPATGFVAGDQYTDLGDSQAPVLNPAIFKCRWAKSFRTYPRLIGPDQAPSGNPFTLFRKGKVNLKISNTIRSPTELSWRQIGIDDLPKHERLYLVINQFCEDNSAVTDTMAEFGSMFTCLNMD